MEALIFVSLVIRPTAQGGDYYIKHIVTDNAQTLCGLGKHSLSYTSLSLDTSDGNLCPTCKSKFYEAFTPPVAHKDDE